MAYTSQAMPCETERFLLVSCMQSEALDKAWLYLNVGQVIVGKLATVGEEPVAQQRAYGHDA